MIPTCSAVPLAGNSLVRGGAACRNRTDDLLITSELLYLLSYVGLFADKYIAGFTPFTRFRLTGLRAESSL